MRHFWQVEQHDFESNPACNIGLSRTDKEIIRIRIRSHSTASLSEIRTSTQIILDEYNENVDIFVTNTQRSKDIINHLAFENAVKISVLILCHKGR